MASPGAKILPLASTQIKKELVAQKGSRESHNNHPVKLQVSTVGQKSRQHQDGLAFQERAHQQCPISVLGNQIFQNYDPFLVIMLFGLLPAAQIRGSNP